MSTVSKHIAANAGHLNGAALAGAAILLDLLRDYLARRFKPDSIWVKLVPIPSMLGIPSFIGCDLCLCLKV